MVETPVQTRCKVTLQAAEPQLFVSDLAASCEFYTKKLGFAVAFSYGEPPFYGQVFRDGARLNLRHVDKPASIRNFASGINYFPHQLLSTTPSRFSSNTRMPASCSRSHSGLNLGALELSSHAIPTAISSCLRVPQSSCSIGALSPVDQK